MRRILYVLVALVCAASLVAQKKDVRGTVSDMDGKPVKGVTIKVLDTKIRVKTNKKGEFLLKSVQPDDSVAVFLQRDRGAKFLLGDVKSLELKINRDALHVDQGNGVSFDSLLDKEVLREYGSGNVITKRMITRNNYLSIKEAIKACIPGISFQYGESGEEKVSIRGVKSLTLSSEPLVILDGSETTLNDANTACSIYDVELIEVYKEGLGYGAKGANGVIVITTKK